MVAPHTALMWAAELEHAELDVRHCGCGEQGRGGPGGSQVVALDSSGAADGDLYLDDGSSFAYQRGACLHRRFRCPPPLKLVIQGRCWDVRSFPRLRQADQAAQGRLRRPGSPGATSETMRRRYQGGFLTSTAFESEGGGGSGVVSGAPFRAEVEIERVVVLGLPGGPKGWQVTHSPPPPALVAALLSCTLVLHSGLQHDRWRPLLPQLLKGGGAGGGGGRRPAGGCGRSWRARPGGQEAHAGHRSRLVTAAHSGGGNCLDGTCLKSCRRSRLRPKLWHINFIIQRAA